VSVISGKSTPKRRTDLACHFVDDEALIYDAERNATSRLNSTAHFIWEQCDGTKTCDDIARRLLEKWDATLEQARTDVMAALKQLARHKLIDPGTRR
jgi:methyltransferase-like protein